MEEGRLQARPHDVCKRIKEKEERKLKTKTKACWDGTLLSDFFLKRFLK